MFGRYQKDTLRQRLNTVIIKNDYIFGGADTPVANCLCAL